MRAEHDFYVTVTGCNAEQAEQVMAERLNHDEDYGFDYEVSYMDVTDTPTSTATQPLRFAITSSDLSGYWSKGERRRWYVTGNRPDWDDDLTWGNFPTWQEALAFANARLKEHH